MYTCNLDHKGSHRPAYCTGCSGPLADALVPAAERGGGRSGLRSGGCVGPWRL